MEISILLVQNIVSMFLMGVVGYVIVKIGILKSTDSKTLSTLVVYVFSPCVVIDSFQITYTPSKMKGFLLAMAAAVVIHIIFIVFTKVVNRIFHFNATEKVSVIYSNAGNIVIPLVYAVLGKEWVFYTSAYIIVQTLLIWTHGKALICGKGDNSLRSIVCNPNILAMVLGFVLFIAGIRMPSVLGSTVGGLGNMIGPASMLVIGMLLGTINLRWVFQQKRVYFICFCRLVVLPLILVLLICFSGALRLHNDAENILLVVLLAASAPVAAMVTQMSQVYGGDAKYASVINAMSIVFCIATMPGIVFLYEVFAHL